MDSTIMGKLLGEYLLFLKNDPTEILLLVLSNRRVNSRRANDVEPNALELTAAVLFVVG